VIIAIYKYKIYLINMSQAGYSSTRF